MAGQISTGIASSAMTRAEFGEQDNSESYFENYLETVYARIMNIKVDFTNYAGDTLIFGNRTYGLWGSFRWNNSNTAVFVIGHATLGILGQNVLGSAASVPFREHEQAIWVDFTEDFNDTVYRDSGSTTAKGWGTGSVVFHEGTGSAIINFTTGGSYTATIATGASYIQLA